LIKRQQLLAVAAVILITVRFERVADWIWTAVDAELPAEIYAALHALAFVCCSRLTAHYTQDVDREAARFQQYGSVEYELRSAASR